MESPRQITFLFVHCSIFQEIAGEIRGALEEALDTTCIVKILRPSQYEKFRTQEEIDDQLYWPKSMIEGTIKRIAERRQIDLLLVSDPVLNLIRGKLDSSVQIARLGHQPNELIDLLNAQVYRFCQEHEISFDKEKMEQKLSHIGLKILGRIIEDLEIKIQKAKQRHHQHRLDDLLLHKSEIMGLCDLLKTKLKV